MAVVTEIQQIQSSIDALVCTALLNVPTFVAGFVVVFVKWWKIPFVVCLHGPVCYSYRHSCRWHC